MRSLQQEVVFSLGWGHSLHRDVARLVNYKEGEFFVYLDSLSTTFRVTKEYRAPTAP